MADKSNLIITMTDYESGKEQQKTITDINPTASSSKLATWGQMTAALSKDGYVKTTRIDRTECDNPTNPRQPILEYKDYSATPAVNVRMDLTQDSYTLPLSKLQSGTKLVLEYHNEKPITYDTSRLLIMDLTTTSSTPITTPSPMSVYYQNPNYVFTIQTDGTEQTLSFKLFLARSNTNAEWEKTITITLTGGE